jgi:hypothetical protein
LTLQANKNAADRKAKDAAQKANHAILAKSTVDSQADTSGRKARVDLEKTLKRESGVTLGLVCGHLLHELSRSSFEKRLPHPLDVQKPASEITIK